ncbi:MAG: hypothetical protein IKZ58_01910 [Selenomonadaceae bacterium]|nr:hypothetical protein [Selenomonadaceae bacterium]
MLALRQEALQIVNDIPDNLLAAFVQYLKNFKPDKKISIDDLNVDPKKAAAMKAIAEWQERNRTILESGIDWDKEFELAMEEKYGPFN